MNESVKKILYLLGLIAAVYLLFKFVLPLVFVVIGVFVQVLMWVIIAILLFMVITYIMNLVKSSR